MTGCAATGATTTSRSDLSGVIEALEAPLRRLLCDGRPVAVAFSGGLDSSALIHATARVAAASGAALHALHVHHGLSVHADDWLAHAQAQSAALGIAFHTARVRLDPATGEGIEAQARRLRYAALARLAREAGCERVLLAHHQDDQAETVLLQALRGAGLGGLAAMPAQATRAGLAWCRPWLGLTRAALRTYADMYGLLHVEDESNADPRHARNRLRHQVLPALDAGFPGVSGALAQVASQAQEALACLDELAALDLADMRVEEGLAVARWHAYSPPRRSNVLRSWLKEVLGQPAPRSLVLRLLAQLQPGLAPHRWPAPGGAVAVYRDVLQWVPAGEGEGKGVPGAVLWAFDGLGVHQVRGMGGSLCVEAVSGLGVPLNRLQGLSWRRRQGGEQFQRHPGGMPRSLKKVFQEAGVPAWARDVPLLYAGEALIFVPGLGLDARCLKASGDGLVALQWHRDNAAGGNAGQAGKI